MSTFLLAADIGGSHISSVAINTKDWQVIDARITKSDVSGFAEKEQILKVWTENIKQSIQKSEQAAIAKIRIAIPSPFDTTGKCFQSHPEGKFEALVGINLQNVFEQALGYPIDLHFENDAACFGIGESYFGKTNAVQKSIAITLGTGLGATFISNHQAQKSGEGIPTGGELYDQPFDKSIADDYFSTRWFVAEAEKYGLQVAGVKELIQANDPVVLKAIFQQFVQSFYQFLSPYAKAFEAEAIVIGGSITKAWSHFGAALSSLFQQDVIPVFASDLRERAILLGAAKSQPILH